MSTFPAISHAKTSGALQKFNLKKTKDSKECHFGRFFKIINFRRITSNSAANKTNSQPHLLKHRDPFRPDKGLVTGQYQSERALPIGNPCDNELSNLMSCMRDNDYDNIPCRGILTFSEFFGQK